MDQKFMKKRQIVLSATYISCDFISFSHKLIPYVGYIFLGHSVLASVASGCRRCSGTSHAVRGGTSLAVLFSSRIFRIFSADFPRRGRRGSAVRPHLSSFFESSSKDDAALVSFAGDRSSIEMTFADGMIKGRALSY